jgi:hypothetical protein
MATKTPAPVLPPGVPHLLSPAQLRIALGISPPTYVRWCRFGMPRIGGGKTRPRFNLQQVLAWLERDGAALQRRTRARAKARGEKQLSAR